MQHRTAREIRHRNRFDVLRAVYAADGSVSRQDVATRTGLSFASVSNLIAELIEVGVLVELGHDTSSVGRPRARIAVNPDRGWLVGVDIAETAIHVDLFDLTMTPRRSVDVPVDPAATSPDDIADLVAGAVTELVGGDAVLGLGVSMPGPVAPEEGVSLFSPYWGWRDVPVKAMLAARLPHRIHLDNPLKASTVAELWFGAGREVGDLVVVTLRSGVGVGITVDGVLYRGVDNSAGEWGHMVLVPGGRVCRCGRRGCVEAYVGALGIAATLREIDPDSPLLGADGLATVAAIAAASASPTATAVVERTGQHLGIAVANLVNLVNPRMIVFGGQVATLLGESILDAARQSVADHALSEVSLRLSGIRHNPVSLGAATFALEGFLADRDTFGSVAALRTKTTT
ncbi:ROK family protein [Actinokineospora sp. HUAS TT18]|uniref:ROK family protein n=1 Tax=Actinokineospora sp. HUAS TT18 TaxID=3447451 RepID=UPI003F51AE44